MKTKKKKTSNDCVIDSKKTSTITQDREKEKVRKNTITQ